MILTDDGSASGITGIALDGVAGDAYFKWNVAIGSSDTWFYNPKLRITSSNGMMLDAYESGAFHTIGLYTMIAWRSKFGHWIVWQTENPLSRWVIARNLTWNWNPRTYALLGGATYAAQFSGGAVTINGNLGIGTTTPNYKLHVVGTSRFEWNSIFYGITTIGASTFSDVWETALNWYGSDDNLPWWNISINWWYSDFGTWWTVFINWWIWFNDDLAIPANVILANIASSTWVLSKVGIGTSNPTTTLDVDGKMRIRAVSSTWSCVWWEIAFVGGNFWWCTTTNTWIQFNN